MDIFTHFIRSRSAILSFAVIVVFTLAGVIPRLAPDGPGGFVSVELNLLETSPRGTIGGYAIPASGASTPSGLRSTCSADGGTVTLQWNASSAVTMDSVSPEVNENNRLSNFINIAYAGGGGSSGGSSGGGIGHTGDHSVTYNVTVNGVGSWSTSNTSYTTSVTPGTTYSWSVQACAGGACSASQTSSFRCDPPPMECDDDIDNDGDGGIDWDGGTSLPSTYNMNSMNEVINAVESVEGDIVIPSSALHNDAATADRICQVLGYDTATVTGVGSWYSCGDNYYTLWNGSSWATIPGCSSNTRIDRLSCSSPSSIGGTPDLDCTGPTDDSEDGIGVTLEVQNDTTSSGWTGSDITINPGEEVSLRWTSSGSPDSCSGSGSGFSTGGATDGTDSDITEPTAGNFIDYIVTCNKTGVPQAFDNLRVTTRAPASIDADPRNVYRGDRATVTWSTGSADPATCSVTGPEINLSTLVSSSGSQTVDVNGESTYTIDCGVGGTDSVTIRVLPVIQET